MRGLAILAVVATFPAVLFALVAARMQHVDPASPGVVAVFGGTGN
jgi:hypothetical protein